DDIETKRTEFPFQIERIDNLLQFAVKLLFIPVNENGQIIQAVDGQYLQPSRHHLPVQRYVSPEEFDEMKAEALAMGFTHAACGPF
ncbi:hypothetical protein MJL33_29010, partial [Salmonella enterica subsp. enterica serovar Kentucky]|nr:hypothetical protein [Salmonella enterica subsp. enterica serovar Kentucky]